MRAVFRVAIILGPACPGFNPGSVVNSMIESDGSIAPFSIPPGSAFMVTSVDFVNTDVPPGRRAGYVLRTVDSGIVIAEGYEVNTGLTGSVAGKTILAPSMRVTSALCVDLSPMEGIGTRFWVRGFLIKDR